MQNSLFTLADAVEARLCQVREKLEHPRISDLQGCRATLRDSINEMTALADMCQSDRRKVPQAMTERLTNLRELLRSVFVLLNSGEQLFGPLPAGYDSSGNTHFQTAEASHWKA